MSSNPSHNSAEARAELRRAALEYHEFPTPGKVAIHATKQLVNQHDLALAYSPGVAAPCEEIVKDPNAAFKYTSKGNLVAVISNGTAVLGLGDIGPLASKPVMEGKGVLFKKFAGIDVFDLEIEEKNLDKLVDIIASLEPTFGGINLEDIKAPDCFYIERKLREATRDLLLKTTDIARQQGDFSRGGRWAVGTTIGTTACLQDKGRSKGQETPRKPRWSVKYRHGLSNRWYRQRKPIT